MFGGSGALAPRCAAPLKAAATDDTPDPFQVTDAVRTRGLQIPVDSTQNFGTAGGATQQSVKNVKYSSPLVSPWQFARLFVIKDAAGKMHYFGQETVPPANISNDQAKLAAWVNQCDEYVWRQLDGRHHVLGKAKTPSNTDPNYHVIVKNG